MAHSPLDDVFEEAFLQCPVCLSTFHEPKTLACCHTFCERCLKGIAERNNGRSLPCPLCRETSQVPRGGVSLLPSNSYVNSLVEYFKSANNEPGDPNRSCKGCRKNAVRYCIECGVFLCQRCSTAHQQLPLSKTHQLVTMETYEEKVAKKSPFLRPVVCPRHDGNQIKLFCESCRLPVCAECALFDHPGPEHELRKLEAAAKTRRQQILQQVKYLKDLFDVASKLEMNEQQALDGMKARLEKEEDKLWDRYNRHVMAFRAKAEELQHQLRSDYDRRISSMQARLKGTTDIQRRLQATIQCTKNFLKESNDVGFLSLEKQTASNIQKLVRDIGKRPSTEKLPPVIEFTSNESFLTTVSSKHIGYVGEVTPHSAVRDDSKPSGGTLKLSQKTRRAERGPMATTTSPETVDGRREMNSSRSRSRSRERDRRPRSRSRSPSSDLMRRKRSRTQSSQSPTRRMPSVIGLVPQDLPLN